MKFILARGFNLNSMKYAILVSLPSLLSCSPKTYIKKELSLAEKKFHHHVGFMLYDLKEKKSLAEFNSSKYFTPASNTKIFTFYTSLKLLGDSIASIKYVVKNDSLIFWGLGDPSFLYKSTFDNTRTYNFLSQSNKKLFFSSSNFSTNHLGYGWAWDDYNDNYSAERSPFPVYGNIINITKKSNNILVTDPLIFMNHLAVADSSKIKSGAIRGVDSNDLIFYPSKSKDKQWEIPYHYSNNLLVELLTDTLKKQVIEVKKSIPKEAKILRSIPTDSLYSVMMKVSDNMIAEQLLLACAAKVSDTLSTDIAIKYSLQNYLSDLPDDARWVDGSGLSRYNLFTPRSIVKLWEKIYQEVPQERLFKLLAVGGQPGTLSTLYQNKQPFVFGKTGSLSNNHCLSGYLVTKKGKIFVFSFMNSNFIASSKEIREMMQNLLISLHNKY